MTNGFHLIQVNSILPCEGRSGCHTTIVLIVGVALKLVKFLRGL